MKKATLFDFWSRNLAEARGENDKTDHVLCPFCLQEFGREALADQRLSEEHIIPRSLGGKESVLSCKECNNRIGSRLESQVEKAIAAKEALDGNGPLRTEIEISNSITRGTVAFNFNEGGTSTIEVSDKVSDPVEIDAQKSVFETGIETIQLRVSFGYVPDRLHLGMLRIGYLATFARLGYSGVLCPSFDPIRRQILELVPPHPDLLCLTTEVPGMGPAMHEPFCAFDLSTGGEFQALVVLLKLTRNHSHGFSVLLPAPSCEEDDVIAYLRGVAAKVSEKGVRVTVW
jgi:HNH endonuclease